MTVAIVACSGDRVADVADARELCALRRRCWGEGTLAVFLTSKGTCVLDCDRCIEEAKHENKPLTLLRTPAPPALLRALTELEDHRQRGLIYDLFFELHADEISRDPLTFYELIARSDTPGKWLRHAPYVLFEHSSSLQLFIRRCPLELLKHAPDALRYNPEFCVCVCSEKGWAFPGAPDAMRGHRDVVLAAVRNYGGALEYASEDLRDDLEVVLEAVSHDGMALRFASKRLRGHRGVVLVAVTRDSRSLQFGADDVRLHREIRMTAISGCAVRSMGSRPVLR